MPLAKHRKTFFLTVTNGGDSFPRNIGASVMRWLTCAERPPRGLSERYWISCPQFRNIRPLVRKFGGRKACYGSCSGHYGRASPATGRHCRLLTNACWGSAETSKRASFLTGSRGF